MNRITKDYLTTYAGVAVMAFALVLFFVPTLYELTKWELFGMFAAGFVLLRAPDKFVNGALERVGLGKFRSDRATLLPDPEPEEPVEDPRK